MRNGKCEIRPVVHVPSEFSIGVIVEHGEEGRKWIDELPNKFIEVCNQWDLVIDGESMHGYLGLVVPVRRGADRYVLKITWPGKTVLQEILALRTWDGEGAVKLVDSRPEEGVLLLERLEGKSTLEDVDGDVADIICANLLRRLSVEAPEELPILADHVKNMSSLIAERWEKYDKPFSGEIFEISQRLSAQLAESSSNLIVNYDLHFGNVLKGTREPWLVIDPKVLAGDPEYGLLPLLMSRLSESQGFEVFHTRFKKLVDEAGLNHSRALQWTLVRCVDYWLWALSAGLTEDPKRCEVIMKHLLVLLEKE